MPPGRAPLRALFAPPGESSTIVIVVHGIFDSKFTKYVTVTADFLRRQGFGVLAPDMRWHGCLLAPEWLPTLGIEEGQDLVEWARFLKAKYPDSRIGLVGFSLGGLSVLHALGNEDWPTVFEAGGVVFCPASGLPDTLGDLDSPAPLVDYGLNGLFRTAFHGYLRTRTRRLPAPADRICLFRDFLNWLAGQPVFGSGSTAESILRKADPAPIVSRIKRPTLVLATSNDPIISRVGTSGLRTAATANPRVYVLETPRGGHIGQIGIWPEWTASLLATFFRYSPGVP